MIAARLALENGGGRHVSIRDTDRLDINMEITSFIVTQRDKALLVGDYGSYRKQLSRRLLTVRRKLNHISYQGRKYAAINPITAEDIASNHEYAASFFRS